MLKIMKSGEQLKLIRKPLVPQNKLPERWRGRQPKPVEYEDLAFPDKFGRPVRAGDVVIYAKPDPNKRLDEEVLRFAFVTGVVKRQVPKADVEICLEMTIIKNTESSNIEDVSTRANFTSKPERIVKVDLEHFRNLPFYALCLVMRQRVALKLGIKRLANRGWTPVSHLVDDVIEGK
jgi:hypothetical protein